MLGMYGKKVVRAIPLLNGFEGGVMKKVYMAVTNNKYELPVALFDNLRALSFWSNKSIECLKTAISRGTADKKLNCKYVRVIIDEDGLE